MGGWVGKIARVNLTTGKSYRYRLTKEMAISYLGGRVLAPAFFMMKSDLRLSRSAPKIC